MSEQPEVVYKFCLIEVDPETGEQDVARKIFDSLGHAQGWAQQGVGDAPLSWEQPEGETNAWHGIIRGKHCFTIYQGVLMTVSGWTMLGGVIPWPVNGQEFHSGNRQN